MIRKKSIIFCTLITILLLFTGCVKHHKKILQAPAVNQKKIKRLSSVHQIIIEGNFDIQLQTQNSSSQLVLIGDPLDLEHVKTEIKEDVLRVFYDKKEAPRYGLVKAIINVPYLMRFTYRGQGNVVGRDLKTKQLNLSLYNGGKTNLSGNLRVKELSVGAKGEVKLNGLKSHYLALLVEDKARLHLSGAVHLTRLVLGEEAWVSMYWVKSNYLHLRLKDQAYVQLAGVVDKLDAEIWDKARFNGRYLRVNRGFIKTHNQSVAETSIILRQHTLAMDASDIYFYNIPEMKTDFMACDGSVLDMRDWNSYTTSQYNRYNK